MSSLFESGDRPAQDLTARARIRDAALTQFADRGIRGATMRGVAEAAGVSLGLVQHHFGSKKELRRACDEAVIAAFGRSLANSTADGSIGEAEFLAGLYRTSRPLLRYLARVLVESADDESSAATHVFDQLVAAAEGFLAQQCPARFAPGSDELRDAAAVMAAMHSGTIVLHSQLTRQLGVDPFDPEHTARIGMAMFDVYATVGEFTASSLGEHMRESSARYRATDKGNTE